MSNQGIGLPGILLAVFITLKLAGVIDWSWWWVLSPMWIGLVIAVPIIMAIALINVRKHR